MTPSSHSARQRGFTIIELLVAMAVLGLIVLLVSQIVSSVAGTTTAGRKRINADNQARMVLDRIGADIAGMVRRSDVDYLFEKNAGNDRLFFYSEAPAIYTGSNPSEQNTVALIGYRINSSNQLERLSKALTWNNSPTGSMVFKTAGLGSSADLNVAWPDATAPGSTDADWIVLADQTFRLEIQFLDRTTGSLFSPAANQRSIASVGAVVVTMGVLDNESRQLASGSGSAASLLVDSGTANLAAAWQATVEGSSFASAAGLPRAAAAQVRIYQRTYPVNRSRR